VSASWPAAPVRPRPPSAARSPLPADTKGDQTSASQPATPVEPGPGRPRGSRPPCPRPAVPIQPTAARAPTPDQPPRPAPTLRTAASRPRRLTRRCRPDREALGVRLPAVPVRSVPVRPRLPAPPLPPSAPTLRAAPVSLLAAAGRTEPGSDVRLPARCSRPAPAARAAPGRPVPVQPFPSSPPAARAPLPPSRPVQPPTPLPAAPVSSLSPTDRHEGGIKRPSAGRSQCPRRCARGAG
jgi:hypothetical protein